MGNAQLEVTLEGSYTNQLKYVIHLTVLITISYIEEAIGGGMYCSNFIHVVATSLAIKYWLSCLT